MKRKLIIITVVIVILAIIVFKLAHNKKVLEENKKPIQTTATYIPVKTATAKEDLQEVNILKTGNIAPFEESKIIAGSSGTLQHLKFDLGSTVQQGQVLAVLDNRLLQLDLQKAEESAAKAQNDLNVYTELLAGKAATQEKVDQLKLDYTNSMNAVARTKRQIGDAAVKAPISGVVASKQVEQGVYLNAGAELGSIVNIARTKIQVNLTEAEVYQVKVGQVVKVTTDVYPGKSFSGKISFISPQADATHNYRAEIAIANSQQSILRSGTFVYVDFSKKTQQKVLIIPREALISGSDSTAVYVVDSNVVHQRVIKTVMEAGGMVEVLSGLKPGEEVVVSGQINLKEGTPIRVLK
jgi:membrane fusion protein, multidrug efflux system